ncbi:hypothetical protein HUG17_3317 [Dermatophagoides farinae]|uniref:Uncharacterized protein n=1 Tax=Dermatophagoides farinae TaxID=6954 RepID=A0A9D4NV55_DERFA|nr:hypothetical protein HUG17_3317 [Dermatophagoides farinae]
MDLTMVIWLLAKFGIKDENIEEIFDDYFNISLRYVQRTSYTLDEYHDHRVRFFQRKRFLHTLITTINSWILIIVLLLIITGQLSDYFHYFIIDMGIDHHSIESIIWTIIIALIVAEYKWINIYIHVIRYRCSFIQIRQAIIMAVKNELKLSSRQKLLHFFRIFRIITGFCYYSTTISLAIIYIRLYWFNISEYLHGNRMGFTRLLSTLTMHTIMWRRLYFLFGEILIPMLYLLFTVEYLKIKMKEFIEQINNVQSSTSLISMMNLKNIHEHYVRNFLEICWLHKPYQEYLLFIDLISRIGFILGMIFIHHRHHHHGDKFHFVQMEEQYLTLSNLISILSFIQFIYTQIIIVHIAYFPSKNQFCYRLLYHLSVIQTSLSSTFQSNDENIDNNDEHSKYRTNVRMNLFIQNIIINDYGFYLGRYFLITKYKFIEMLAFNFTLFTMLYKYIRI